MTKARPNPPGTIDLPSLFQAAAEQLLLAVDHGQLLHKSKNIRDAGAPLEHEFRRFLGARLSSPFEVATGYLFDPNSNCTPQVDAIVVDGRDAHELMRSSEGAAYLPYPAAHALIEVKNSAGRIKAHVDQTTAIVEAVNGMHRAPIAAQVTTQGSFEPPLSILVVGKTGRCAIRHAQAAYLGREAPQYTLLLDKGLVIARRAVADDIFTPAAGGPPQLSFKDQPGGADWAIWEPRPGKGRSGMALMWIYFRLIDHLGKSSGGTVRPINQFTAQMRATFPLLLKSDLAAATAW